MQLSTVIAGLERVAPLAYQENYDNAGLYCGDLSTSVHRILTTLDITEEVIDEAIKLECQLIVAHHPILFKPIKRLVGQSYVERCLLKAVRHNVALYAAHTNLDNSHGGVNFKLAQKLGLRNVQVLEPMRESLSKLVVFVPLESTEHVLDALYKAGAGQLGNYKNCSFRVEGTGAFTPAEGAAPFIGQLHRQEEVKENRIEVFFPHYLSDQIVTKMREAHPYEEVAYYIQDISNLNQEAGAGAIGELETSLNAGDFLAHLKSVLPVEVVRFTPWTKKIHRVAVCGGAGSFLLKKAISRGADAFVSADFKYHEFFEAEGRVMIADIGHYESEFYTKELLLELLKAQGQEIEVFISTANTNPIRYHV